MRPTLVELADQLAAGATTAQELVAQCLERIDDPRGEGRRALPGPPAAITTY